MNKVYYSQIDKRWSNYPYPSQELPYATLASAGCGVACGAMIVSMLKQIVLPTEIADMFLKDGIRVNGGTSNRAFDSYITDKYGLKVEKKWKLDDAVTCLKKGGLVVARCLGNRGELFCGKNQGHFIVLSGYNNGTIEVFDPYLTTNKFNTSYRKGKVNVSGVSTLVSYSNMKEYGGYCELWCYEPTGIETGAETPKRAFIKRVQKAINARVDGIVGNETRSKVPTLSKNKNRRHAVVKVVQEYLIDLGYAMPKYGADGVFGNETEIAVKKLQQDKKIVADGVIGKYTWNKLFA